MKFDMSKAWNDALALLSGNLNVVAVVAGVFFFLPYLALMLTVPDMASGMAAGGARGAGPADAEAAMAAAMAMYAANWWLFAIIAITQGIGMLALLSLLTDRSRPTVGEAIGFGAKALLPYLGTAILTALIFVLAIFVPVAIASATGSPIVVGLVSLIGFVLGVYLYTKLSLTAPVIGVERILNPVKVIARSWALTKGNSLRIFLFYFLLLLVFGVISLVVGMVVGLIFGFMGPSVAVLGTGVFSALINAVFVCLFLAILAAIHRQLSGGTPQGVSATFD